MSVEDKEKYYELNKENENLVKNIVTMQNDIKKCKEMIQVHADSISKSKVRRLLQKRNFFIINHSI